MSVPDLPIGRKPQNVQSPGDVARLDPTTQPPAPPPVATGEVKGAEKLDTSGASTFKTAAAGVQQQRWEGSSGRTKKAERGSFSSSKAGAEPEGVAAFHG